MVTSFQCWCPKANVKDSGCWWPKWPKLSPTFYSCHQRISSPTSVTSINVTVTRRLCGSVCLNGSTTALWTITLNPSFCSKTSNYFPSILMISMGSMDMPSLLEQFYIHLTIIWPRNILNHWCLMSTAKSMVKWMKCFVLSEAVSLRSHLVYFFDICIKGSGINIQSGRHYSNENLEMPWL